MFARSEITKCAVTHFGFDARVSSQFRDDSQDYKVGVNVSHKSGNFDLFAAGTFLDRGITYDANGRRIGLSPSSSIAEALRTGPARYSTLPQCSVLKGTSRLARLCRGSN